MDSTGWLLLTLVILLFCSAFFSAAETAYSTVNKIRLKTLAASGNKRAVRALLINENYDRTLSTILIGNNVVNIAASSIGTILAIHFVGESAAAAVSTVAMTILVLLFGEVSPKSYAKLHAEQISLSFSGVMQGIIVIFTPFSKLLVMVTNLINRFSRSEDTPSVTEEELKYIIETTVEEGVLHENESELLQSVIEFDDTKAQDILTHRVDMAAIDVASDIKTVTDFVLEERYSRIPVYEGSIDKIIGILQSRDFLEELALGHLPDIRSMLSECMYVHKTMKISALLGEFKRKKINLAVVMDDYGGTLGIVTTEDILEELVGEIWDEDDEIESDFKEISEGKYEIAGDYSIRDMLLDLDLASDYIESDARTVGGWALEEFGRIPDEGDRFTSKRLTLTVSEIAEQRIIKMALLLAQDEPDHEAREGEKEAAE